MEIGRASWRGLSISDFRAELVHWRPAAAADDAAAWLAGGSGYNGSSARDARDTEPSRC